MGKTNFSGQFRIFNLNVMRQSAYIVINIIKVSNFADLFNCSPMDRASDTMMNPTCSYSFYFIRAGVSVRHGTWFN